MISKFKDGEITSFQSYIMIISIMVGTGVLGLARSVAEIAKQDAWISVLVNGIGISIIIAFTIFVISKFPQLTFIQYMSLLLTKPLAYLVVFAYGIYAIFTTSLIIRFLCEMVGTWFLPRTPLTVISFIIVATLVYITKDGLTFVGRFNEIIVLAIIPFIFLIFPSLSEASLINLKPIGDSGIHSIIKGIPPSFYAFGGYEVILIIYPFISNKNKMNIRYSMLAILFVTVLYTSIVASQIALFGYQEITEILYSFINYLDVIDFPIIERIEIFFTFFWTFAVIGTLSIQFIAGCIAFQSVFKTKKTNTFVYLFTPIIYILSLLPENSVKVAEYSEIVGKANVCFGIFLPIILFIMYLIWGRKKAYDKTI
ncbi:GerAB/ArcD/ProY family transporter [Alkaliphilus peptidifermentans]|uniref:Spore germination protein (Amino acid permease) n=1 Tax=Alkaliphilus peptidifermentans DSM 18978 TaxID=1120976 RepID=A0A1G5KB87_9FIRM|nr:endospore germination permease [Alkaliphilus peptidifermentans]SCY97318.1 spore germination protein (amino acid permease) [Alkaliphilus peptidifermentans DSM 18978]